MGVVDIHIAEVLERVSEKGARLTLTDEAKEFLVRVGSNEEYGARPLRRAVQQYLEDHLAELMLQGALEMGKEIVVTPSPTEEKLVFEPAVQAAEGVTT
jgi:ATP-dependent Clp protease ATP-binding subunit ClpC